MTEKYIVYKEDDKVTNIKKAEEDLSITKPYQKIRWLYLFWLVFKDKGFRIQLQETIKYAIIHHDCYRGQNASDVILFTHHEKYPKIWKNKIFSHKIKSY